jgi:hypothetical protein
MHIYRRLCTEYGRFCTMIMFCGAYMWVLCGSFDEELLSYLNGIAAQLGVGIYL